MWWLDIWGRLDGDGYETPDDDAEGQGVGHGISVIEVTVFAWTELVAGYG